MAGLPPKPGDSLLPRPSRGATSPRAASMRDDPIARERDRERDRGRDRGGRDGRRRRSPESRRFSPQRPDGWRRPPRDDDRYQDQPPRSTRDRDERERPRPRGIRDRGAMDTYKPDSSSSSRRRSPPPHARRRPSRSRSRSPRPVNDLSRSPSPPLPHRSRSPEDSRSPSSRKPARSQSPHRRVVSPRSHRASRERHIPKGERASSPHRNASRQEPDPSRSKNRVDNESLPSKGKAASEIQNRDFPSGIVKARSPDPFVAPPPPPASDTVRQKSEVGKPATHPPKGKVSSPVRKLPTHPPPSGPRRPRTPTGPRARSPAQTRDDHLDDTRVDKGKSKETPWDEGLAGNVRRRDRSLSPPRGPRKRTRRSWTRSHSRSCSRSRSLSHLSRSASPHSPSHSHQTTSERASPRAQRKDFNDKIAHQLPNIDDLIPPLPPRESRTALQDAELQRIKEQRARFEQEHASITRAVRRAQHELDIAGMELRSAEERRKAAQRVHERTVKGFLAPIN